MTEPADRDAIGSESTETDEPVEAAEEFAASTAVESEPVDEPVEAAEEESEESEEELATHVADEIRELASERDTYKDIAQRLQADFENYRKRVAAQIHDEANRAASRMAEAMLPVLDATEAAYLRHPDEVGPLLNVMLGELRKHGLETLDLQDKPFDPTVAEAVTHESGDGGEVVVAEVLRSGYRWNGRTLRPAMVRTRD